MAKKAKKKDDKDKKQKSGLTLDQERQILNMRPEDLAVESFREENALEVLKLQLKQDGKISQLQEKVDEFKDVLEGEDDVTQAKAALEEARSKHKSKDHTQAEEDLRLLKKSWTADIRQRSKKSKFMKRALKRHMESGALKSKLD